MTELIPITETQAKALKAFGIEPDICYAVPKKLHTLIMSLGGGKRKPIKATTIKRKKPAPKTNTFAYVGGKHSYRPTSYSGGIAAKLEAASLSDGQLITRTFIYGLIPHREKRSWVVQTLVRDRVIKRVVQ